MADASVDDPCFTPAVDLADMVRRPGALASRVGALLERVEPIPANS